MKDKENLHHFNQANIRACQLKQLDILLYINKVCRQIGIPYWLDGGTLLGAIRHGGFIPWDDDIDIAMKAEDMKRFVREAQALLPDHLFLQTPDTDPQSKEPIIKVRDLNSLYIEQGDNFQEDYVKGIYVDIFPFVGYPDISRRWIKVLTRGISKSYSILHHVHRYSLRSVAEWGWFGLKYWLFSAVWKILCLNRKMTRCSDIPILNGRGISFDKQAVFPLGKITFEGYEFPAPNNPDSYLTDLYGDYMKIPPVEKRESHALFILPTLNEKES